MNSLSLIPLLNIYKSFQKIWNDSFLQVPEGFSRNPGFEQHIVRDFETLQRDTGFDCYPGSEIGPKFGHRCGIGKESRDSGGSRP